MYPIAQQASRPAPIKTINSYVSINTKKSFSRNGNCFVTKRNQTFIKRLGPTVSRLGEGWGAKTPEIGIVSLDNISPRFLLLLAIDLQLYVQSDLEDNFISFFQSNTFLSQQLRIQCQAKLLLPSVIVEHQRQQIIVVPMVTNSLCQ